MCGIWGLISRGEARGVNFAALASAFSFIGARGPDGQGVKRGASFGHSVLLAHTRRAIIELSALGAQPMVDPDSGWWIVFNGEIYNYLEIRAELRRVGHSFSTGSDTEVLLHAWAQWGLGALDRCNGMFAFAAFNPARGELWLVRDRFGVKPLAWGHCPNGDITFGSSVAGVAQQVGAEVDTAYCVRGVRNRAYETAESGSPFENVKTVQAGCWTRLQLSRDGVGVTEGRWYRLKQAVAARLGAMAQIGDTQLLEECRALFLSAVRLRLRSDVPVALSLSAGLDSTSIAGVMRRHLTQLRGFTFGSPSASASEGPGTAAFSETIGIDVSYVWPEFTGSGLCDALETTFALQEAPFSGLSPIAQNEVFRAVSGAGFKVLLGGQGSDEIFAGYRKFFIVALREALFQRAPKGALRLIYSLGVMLAHEAGQARMYWQNRERYLGANPSGFRLLDWEPVAENLWGRADITLFERQIEDIEQWSIPTLLRYEDRNSMGYGVETRLPFMDYRLIEYALALPTRLKIANGYGKWALRRMAVGLVPDAIRLNRKKRGFDVTADWIGQGIGASLRERIFDNAGALSGALKPGARLDALLSDAALARHPDLLDEALMLAWLVKPIRAPRQAALAAVRAKMLEAVA
jgi:asparagine synthase (glutamine-hydrolysing)